jgi:clan AA aspartic protease (TIGR02281 family)
VARHLAPCGRARGFGVSDNPQRAECRDHFNHYREGEWQTEADIFDAEEPASKPGPELTDWIGRRRTAVTTKGVDRAPKFSCAFFETRRFNDARAIGVELRDISASIRRACVMLRAIVREQALIDTGATYLSMCHSTASALQLALGDRLYLSTANGIIPARYTTVASVRIGGIEVRNVAAVVDDPSVPCADRALVGMSLLRKLHVTVDNDKLVLVGQGSLAATDERWLFVALCSLALLSVIGIAIGRKRVPWPTAPTRQWNGRANTHPPSGCSYTVRIQRRWGTTTAHPF